MSVSGSQRQRVLVTGGAGFAGRHLLLLLSEQGDSELVAAVRPDGPAADLPDGVTTCSVELTDAARVLQLVREVQPTRVYHLAAFSSAAEARRDPLGTIINNVASQVNLMEAVVESRLEPRVLIVGSGDEYGNVPAAELPIREDSPLRPLNPYSVSKVTQDLLGYQYAVSHGLAVVRVRPFNHTGPGQEPRFVVPAFARQIARIEAGLQPPLLEVGNLSAERDFTDVRDVVRAYRLAIEQGEPGEVYNIGSGQAVSIQHVLDILLGLCSRTITVQVDPGRLRTADASPQVASYEKLRLRTGWQPTIPLAQTLADVLSFWRERVGALAAQA